MTIQSPARFQEGKPWLGRSLDEAARVAVTEVLGVSPGERVLVVTNPDPELSRVALAVHDASAAVGAEPILLATQPRSGAQLADPVLLRALETDPQVLVLLTKGRIGGDPERLARPIHGTYTHYLQYLLSEAPTRGFWGHGVSRSAFTRGVPVDYEALRQEAESLTRRFQDVVELRIQTGKNLELVLPVKGPEGRQETGDYKGPGASGELPTGEFVVPVEPGGASGRLQVSGGLGLPEESLALRDPLQVTLEGGAVTNVQGGDGARRLEAAMADGERLADAAVREGWLTRDEAGRFAQSTHRVKEVALGLNPALKPRGDPVADAKGRGVIRVVVGAGLREYPPGAPVSLELIVPGAKITAVAEDGTESPLLSGGRFVPGQSVRS